MVKTKTIRPKKARSQGEILPHIERLEEYVSWENFHVKRTSGSDTKFKDTTVRTINLNSNWIDTVLMIGNMTQFYVGEEATITAELRNLNNSNSLTSETIVFNIGGTVLTAKTGSDGSATVKYTPSKAGTLTVKLTYEGNPKKGYKEADPVTDTVTVNKVGVTITQDNLQDLAGKTISIKPIVKDEFGNKINTGTLSMVYGDFVLYTENVVNGTCTFNRSHNEAIKYNYWLSYPETEKYKHATCNFSIEWMGYDTVIAPRQLTYDIIKGTVQELRARVLTDETRDPVKGGTVTWKEGNTVLGTSTPDSEGLVTYNYSNNTTGSHTITLEYSGSGVYLPSSRNITVNVKEKTSTTVSITGSTSMEKGTTQTLTATVKDSNGNPLSTGTVTFKEGNTVLGTVNVVNGVAKLNYTGNTVETHNLTISYGENEEYKSATDTYSITVTKITTQVSIQVNDILDFISNSGTFNVKVTDTRGNGITEGTLNIYFRVEKIGEQEKVASFTLDSTNKGNFSIGRYTLDLDTLFNTVSNRKYLFYTGYRVIAEYTGNTNFKDSVDTAQPVNIGASKSMIYPYVVIHDTADYNIQKAINDEVPASSKSNTVISVNHISTSFSVEYKGKDYNISDFVDCGTVQKGQTIYFATEYTAFRVPDNLKELPLTRVNEIPESLIGGLNTELHYQINNGAETDTANAYINGTTTRYAGPLYTKFTVPNTVKTGDYIRLYFYVGNNKGYYHYINGNSDWGLLYKMQFKVVE